MSVKTITIINSVNYKFNHEIDNKSLENLNNLLNNFLKKVILDPAEKLKFKKIQLQINSYKYYKNIHNLLDPLQLSYSYFLRFQERKNIECEKLKDEIVNISTKTRKLKDNWSILYTKLRTKYTDPMIEVNILKEPEIKTQIESIQKIATFFNKSLTDLFCLDVDKKKYKIMEIAIMDRSLVGFCANQSDETEKLSNSLKIKMKESTSVSEEIKNLINFINTFTRT